MPPKKYTLPSELPDGWILTDSDKKRWRIGKIIGKGGFGLIYLASGDVLVPVRDDADFVIKVEYHENGPLFSELKFYQRAAKPDTMNKWKKSKCLEFLGIPTYWGSGLSEYNGTRYRFMVMDRLGTDLQKVIGENGGQLRKPTALRLGVLMLDVLEYIHDNEYVHADIKAANLLLGHRDPNNVYLADYGLSYRYCPNGQHKEYKENPKKGHNGTIEYTSIDAHKGVVPSRRGDLEVLGYCLLHWQCGTLPWWSFLRNPAKVQEEKAKLMSSLPDSVTSMSTSDSTTEELNEESCADFNQHYEEIANFLLYVKELDYNAKPDYQILRQVLSGPGMLELLDLSRPRRPDTSRPVTQRTRSQPKRTEKTARSKPVATLEEDYEEDLSRSNIVRSRMTRETHEQKPPRFNTAAKGRPRQRSAFMDSDEDSNDEEASLPPRAHSKTRAGARQRQTLQQERRKAEFYGEAWITEDRRNKCEHQTGYTRGLNDDCVEVGNYRRKHNWDYNRWEEPDYSEDPWRSSACQWENEQVPYNNRETDYLGKPAKCAKRGIRSTKGKWILIVLFVVLFTAVGIVLRLRLLK